MAAVNHMRPVHENREDEGEDEEAGRTGNRPQGKAKAKPKPKGGAKEKAKKVKTQEAPHSRETSRLVWQDIAKGNLLKDIAARGAQAFQF